MAFPLFPKIPGRAKPAAAKPKPTSKAHRDGSSEGGREQVRSDGYVGQRRMEGLAGVATQPPVRPPLDRERRPEGEVAHRDLLLDLRPDGRHYRQ